MLSPDITNPWRRCGARHERKPSQDAAQASPCRRFQHSQPEELACALDAGFPLSLEMQAPQKLSNDLWRQAHRAIAEPVPNP